MLTPTSGQVIVIPATQEVVADGLWIQNITIMAPSPTRPIALNMRIAPFNSQNGTIYPNLAKSVSIPDVMQECVDYPSMGLAMAGILSATQDLITGRNLF